MNSRRSGVGSLSRRNFMIGSALAGTALSMPLSLASPRTAGNRDAGSGSVRDLMKMRSSLNGKATPWWFGGYIYAIQLGRRPIPLVRCEGCEIYFPLRLENGDYLERGATLTFFLDLSGKRWLHKFRNPLTSRETTVEPNSLASGPDAGYLYPADGSAPYLVGKIARTGQLDYVPPQHSGGPPDAGQVAWSYVDGRAFVIVSRGVDTPSQPWLEVATMIADAAALADPATESVAANGSVSYVSPWLKWMAMSEVPGHLFWHVSSQKLAAVSDMPRRYLRHAEKIGLLSTLDTPGRP